MKVLFAVGSDQLSKNIADKYYEKYGEVLEYKNVFFFKALIDEVKKNKTYDRIVINEEFEQFRATDLEQIDRAIFNYIDKVTDEIQDAEIVLICANRRNPGDSFVNKLFSIGIYNMLIGNDRNMNPLCDIIKKPRTKREAKEYLHIDTSIISSESITKDNEVEEHQIKSILAFFDGIRNQPDKFLETFDRVAEQYSMTQLKIIVEYLPKFVKDEIFKADRYKYLMPQVDNSKTVNTSNVAQQQANVKNEQQRKRGLFGFKKSKMEPIPKGGSIDMAQMQPGGRVDLSSNIEEQKNAAKEAELAAKAKAEAAAKQQAELEARARAEAAARQQAELEAKARAEAAARQQAELEAKARAEAAAREQAELAAKAKAEVQAREQAELAAKARAEAVAREQAMLAEKAKAEERQKQLELEARARAEAAARQQAELAAKAKSEALAREQAMLAEKAKAEASAKEQAELAAKARAEAMARQQAELAAKAKAEAVARENAGLNSNLNSNLTAGVQVQKRPGEIVEIKPNPNAPDRKIERPQVQIPTPTHVVNPIVDKKEFSQNMSEKPQVSVASNININPEPVKKPEPIKIEPVKIEPVKSNIEIDVNPVIEKTKEPEVNIPVNNAVSSANNLVLEQEKKMREEQEKLAIEQRKIREAQERLEEEKRKLREEQEKFVSAQTQLRNEAKAPTPAPQYTNTTVPMQTVPVANYKKMVVFVGANKVGTTFITNAIAHNVASSKILTSIIDMTRDKSMYYIYADESKALKNRAAECMQRLSDGEDYYIETMNSHLKLYTTVAGAISDQRRGYKHKTIIETVKNNCNLTIVDADFTTPIDYFDQADEIYLIQDLDILKIQDVTLFLREINARGLDKKKIKLIINKYVKTSITPKIIIGALDFYHDPGGTYVDSGLMPAKVDYSLIPYNLNNYAKYVESLHKMSGNFNYKNYSTDFNQAIDEIVAKVYPKNIGGKRKFFG